MICDESGGAVGLIDAVRRYVRVLICVLAVCGLGLVIGLQSGWVGLVWSPPPALVEVVERDGGNGGSLIRVTGPTNVFAKDMIAVDTGRTYRLDADVRVLPKEDGSAQTSVVYFGVSTYDVDGAELKSGPGTYRYAGALGRNISSNEGWVHLSGAITGEGNENYKQFRPGTRSVKLVLLANYQSKDEPVLLIRDVTFSELVTLAP
jgi:hypothetical protein